MNGFFAPNYTVVHRKIPDQKKKRPKKEIYKIELFSQN